MLSSEVQGKVVEAFEVFDHENNKTVDVREVVFLNLSFEPFTQKIISEGGHHSKGSCHLCFSGIRPLRGYPPPLNRKSV